MIRLEIGLKGLVQGGIEGVIEWGLGHLRPLIHLWRHSHRWLFIFPGACLRMAILPVLNPAKGRTVQFLGPTGVTWDVGGLGVTGLLVETVLVLTGHPFSNVNE